MSERTYRVVVTREDGAWLADVPDLEGTHTYARNLPGLDQSVREVIAMVEDLPDGAEAGLQLAYEYHTGDPTLDEAAARLRADRDRIQVEKQRVERLTVELAQEMIAHHRMSVRDAAALIGVAPQRISQVAPSAARSKSTSGWTSAKTGRAVAATAKTGRATKSATINGKPGKSEHAKG